MERHEKELEIELVGKEIRAKMPWLNKGIDSD